MQGVLRSYPPLPGAHSAAAPAGAPRSDGRPGTAVGWASPSGGRRGPIGTRAARYGGWLGSPTLKRVRGWVTTVGRPVLRHVRRAPRAGVAPVGRARPVV